MSSGVDCIKTEFLLPDTKSAQSFSIWQRLLGHTAWYSHGHLGVGWSPGARSDSEIKPWTDTFPDVTRSPGNSQDLQKGSSAWWGTMLGVSAFTAFPGIPGNLGTLPCPHHISNWTRRCCGSVTPCGASFSSGGSKQTLVWGSALQWCSK